MPPKIKQDSTTSSTDPNAGRNNFITQTGPVATPPSGVLTSANLPGAGVAAPLPADAGNPNAPSNPQPQPPQSGTFIDSDPNNSGLPTFTVEVNGKLITLTANSNIKGSMPIGAVAGDTGKRLETVQTVLNSITSWYANSTTRQKYIDQMYAAGLISSKKAPTAEEVTRAWTLVVQESALQIQDPNGDMHLFSPDEVLAKAAQSGWNSASFKQSPGDVGVSGTGNQNNSTDSTSQSQTVYKSYVDPATAAGTLADAYFRLMGRNPNPSEYNAFFNSLYTYQQEENTGTIESKETGPSGGQAIDPATGQPVGQTGSTSGTDTTTNTVSQRGIAQRGIQFLAGQQALASPEEGAYQAATTYFNAFIKALQGPASGMEASGPTTTVP